jgi:hypothetical protein
MFPFHGGSLLEGDKVDIYLIIDFDHIVLKQREELKLALIFFDPFAEIVEIAMLEHLHKKVAEEGGDEGYIIIFELVVMKHDKNEQLSKFIHAEFEVVVFYLDLPIDYFDHISEFMLKLLQEIV